MRWLEVHMAVVTIRGQLGSGAPEIGKLIADRLLIDYVVREIIADVAKKINWSEENAAAREMPPGTLIGRIMDALGHSYPTGIGYSGAYLPTWEIPLDNVSYLVGLETVIKKLAESKALVIRGRGSQFILKDFPGALHILVVAPFGLRIKRVMENTKLGENEARKEIERFDSSRHEFTKRYFHADLEESKNYDLVINTEHFNVDDAAGLIVDALPFKDKAYIPNKQ